MCVDGRQQQHELVDGDGRRVGQRQRQRELQCRGECEHESAHGHAHGRRPDVQCDASRAACSYAIAPTSQSVVAGGGTGSTSVTAQTGCAWTAVSNNTSWLTVTAGASGSGNGSVSFSAAANASTSQRTGTLTVGGQTFNVTQAGAACSYAIAPTSQSVVAGGGTGSTSVTAQTGCAWTAVSNNTSWLTVTAGASGSGNGSVSFSAAANASTSQRTGTLTVGGQTFSVTQAGARVFVCDCANESVGRRWWRHGVDERHRADRLCVDGCQQQHELVDGDGGRVGQRQRQRELQCRGEREHESAHGHAHGGRPDVQRDAGGAPRVRMRLRQRVSRWSLVVARDRRV